MKTKIKCPWCDQEYLVDSSLIGQVVKCESCDKDFSARNVAAVSPLSNPYLFDSKKQKTNTVPSNKSTKQQASFVPPDPIEAPPKNYYSTNKAWNWIKAFLGFKIMITPVLVRMSYLLLLIWGAIILLVYPIKSLGKSVYTGSIGQIILFVLLYVVIVFLGIPLLALILHAIYEMTMIPFSILNTLLEIRNKLDEKS